MNRGGLRLESIEIKGFKSFTYTHPLSIELGDVNILIGANGSGKSNIISFFRMIASMMKGAFQKYVAIMGTSQKLLHYGSQTTPSISVSLRFSKDHEFEIYSFTLSHVDPNRLIVPNERIEISNPNESSDPVIKQLGVNLEESTLPRATEDLEMDLHKLLSSCRVYQFCDTTTLSALRQPSVVNGAHYLYSDGGNLAAFLYFLKNNYSNSYRRIKRYVEGVFPQFKDFYLEPVSGYVSLNWTEKGHEDYVMTSDQLSDGTLRYIALTTLLLQPPQTLPFVILLDEPELDLHPIAVEQLNVMISEAALHAQIVIATQSHAILDGFSINDVIVFEHDRDINGAIATQLSENEYKEWLDTYTLSELWKKMYLEVVHIELSHHAWTFMITTGSYVLLFTWRFV